MKTKILIWMGSLILATVFFNKAMAQDDELNMFQVSPTRCEYVVNVIGLDVS